MFQKWLNNHNGHNHNGKEPLIDLKAVVKKYDSISGGIVALKGIDLQVRSGEYLAITGKSGSGKTTLVNMITGLDRATSGELHVAGADLHTMNPEQIAYWRGRTIGVVFQTFELLPTLNIVQNVTLPMDFAGRYSEPQRRKRALELLTQVDIIEHAYKSPVAISGGQQQRVAIARAMANEPPILIADEPTGSLDSVTASAVLDIFESLVEQGKTVILVTHDRDVARRASRTITLSDGEIITEKR